MILNIFPNNLEIHRDYNEVSLGKIERIIYACSGLNTRRFMDLSQNVLKYQIGKEDSYINWPCSKCEICCSYNFGYCVRKRYLFKIILDNTLNECGEFNYVSSEKFFKKVFMKLNFQMMSMFL